MQFINSLACYIKICSPARKSRDWEGGLTPGVPEDGKRGRTKTAKLGANGLKIIKKRGDPSFPVPLFNTIFDFE